MIYRLYSERSEEFTLAINKERLFFELINNFLAVNEKVEAVIISDQEGFVIAGEKREEISPREFWI